MEQQDFKPRPGVCYRIERHMLMPLGFRTSAKSTCVGQSGRSIWDVVAVCQVEGHWFQSTALVTRGALSRPMPSIPSYSSSLFHVPAN